MSIRRLVAAPTLVAGLVAAALVAQTGLASPARAAGPRYASPTGTTAQTCLTVATACSIEKAVNSAVSGDEVIILPGAYVTSTTLTRPSSVTNLNVHGLAGLPRPIIATSASPGISLFGANTKVADLTVQHTGDLYGLNVFATGINIQRVEVTSSGPVTCGAGISGLVRDSLCVNTAVNGIALDDSWGGDTGVLTLRNVTAVAGAPGSYGIRADASGNNTNLDINARNVIAAGAVADVRSTEVGLNSESDVVLQNSNYDTVELAGGGFATTAGSGSNQKLQPVFADGAYHQAATSPTINAGATDASTGSFDIDNQARPGGGAMDIGADEYYPDTTPPDTLLTGGPGAKTRKRKVVFTFTATEPAGFVCKVDKSKPVACGSPFKVKVKRYGKHRLVVIAVDQAGNVDPTPVAYQWRLKHKKKKHKHRHHH